MQKSSTLRAVKTVDKTKDSKKGFGIGTKFTGPNAFHCTTTGTYWETLPELSDSEKLIQRFLLNHAKDLRDRANGVPLKSFSERLADSFNNWVERYTRRF